MNVFIIVLLSLLLISIIAIGVMIIKTLGVALEPQPVKIDVELKNLNAFIRREFLFEYVNWILYAPTTIEMNGPVKMPSFIKDIKDPDVIKKKMSIIVSRIISKMSIYLIRDFKAVYKLSKEDDSPLYEYVSRQIMFYIRRADFEITSMFELDTESKPTDLLKQYVLTIEAEIYKLNNILIVSDESKSSSTENAEEN